MGAPSAIGQFTNWLGRWLGRFAICAIFESDPGFASEADIRWGEFCPHWVGQKHKPERCRPMRCIIHDDYRREVQIANGKGRFMITNEENLVSIFAHLPVVNEDPENDLIREQCLNEMSKTIRQRSAQQCVLVQGDFNVDWLPAHQLDPHQELARRQEKHQEERLRLQAWAENHRLEITLPHACMGPHELHEPTLTAPISKINATGPPYALLDATMATPGLVRSSWLVWKPLQSDHTVLVNEIMPWRRKRTRVGKRKWLVRNVSETSATFRAVPIYSNMSVEVVSQRLQAVQNACADPRSCRVRSQARVPAHVRAIYQQIARAEGHAKKDLRKKASWRLRIWRRAERRHKLTEHAKRGKLPARPQKLHDIHTISAPGAQTLEEGIAMTKVFFEAKWACHDQSRLHQINDIINTSTPQQTLFTQQEITSAGFALNKRLRIDRDGTSSEAWRLLGNNNHYFCDWLASNIVKEEFWMQFCVHGLLKGKSGQDAAPDDMRALLPLVPLAQLCDAMIAQKLQHYIDLAIPDRDGIYRGARQFTQTCEIPLSLQLLLEKSQDYGLGNAVGQIDALSHYDNLDIIRIAKWLQTHGVPDDLVRATVIFQTMIPVELQIAGECIQIDRRTRGGLTGTRTAGQLGRVPIEDAMNQVHAELEHYGAPLYLPADTADQYKPVDCACEWKHFVQLTFASFVDNVYFAGRSVTAALALAGRFEEVLQDKWGQTIKPQSRQICLPRGVPSGRIHLGKWEVCDGFRVLGVEIQDNAETDRSWMETAKTARKLFWRISRTADYRSLAAEYRLRTLDAQILPFLLHRLTALPLHFSRLYQVQKLQREFYAKTLRIKLPQGLTKQQRAQQRQAIVTSRMTGRFWHQRLASSQVKLDAHVRRSAWRKSWPGMLAFYRDPAKHQRWLQTGRLCRRYQGHVPQRWDRSVSEARGHADDELLVSTRTSAKYRTSYSLEADEANRRIRKQRVWCCLCKHEGSGADYVVRTQCGTHACQVHSDVCAGGYTCERDTCHVCASIRRENQRNLPMRAGGAEHNFQNDNRGFQNL